MKYYKILVVAIVSAVVAILTSIMGVTGTIIGSVISSVGYNVLVEIFEKPVSRPSRQKSFEWDIVYVFPIVVIALVQLLMILGFFSNMGYLPSKIYVVYSILQDLTQHNLYRIMGFSLIVLALYPYLLKSKAVNKTHGKYLLLVGIIFLARGLTDASFIGAGVLSKIFAYFDLPIAIIAFIILCWTIISIFTNKHNYEDDYDDLEYVEDYPPQYRHAPQQRRTPRKVNKPIAKNEMSKRYKKPKSFNSSSDNIQFDSRNHYKRRR